MPTIKRQTIGMVTGLTVQYLLGIYTNMFVKFPESGTAGEMWRFAKAQPILVTHMLLGILLLLNSIWLFARTLRSKDKNWKIFSGIGALAILLASFGGVSFVPSQNDLYSFLMATTFIISLLSYGLGIYLSRSKK